MNKKKIWNFGDSKIDRKGRQIFFIGYSEETNSKSEPIELWESEKNFINMYKNNE